MPTINRQRPKWIKEKIPFERKAGNDNSHIYNSWRWKRESSLHKQANPLCVRCLEQGVVTAVYCTDHITPINEGGAVWDHNNWQSLCWDCHQHKSNEERNRKRFTV